MEMESRPPAATGCLARASSQSSIAGSPASDEQPSAPPGQSTVLLRPRSGALGTHRNSSVVRPLITPGTKIPLGLLNTVGTKHSIEGDRVYLETVFPIVVNNRILIPAGSYVAGTLTQVKRPERRHKDWHGKGRGELFLRFDSL